MLIDFSALLLAAVTAAQDGAPATYEADIKPLAAKLCADCHGPKSPTLAEFKKDKEGWKKKDKGPRMDTYENLMIFVNGEDTGALMRRLDDGKNTKDGKPGNMNEHLGEKPEDRAANLAVFKRWIGGWTLKRAAEITDVERQAIKAAQK